MKLLFLIALLMVGLCCENYQYIDNSTRFNKSKGTIDILSDDGQWISKSERILRQIKKEKEKERKAELERIAQLNIFPAMEKKNVTGRAGFDNDSYSGSFFANIENNSNWKIEEIVIVVNINNSIDSTYLTKREFTGTSYSNNDGVPFIKTKYWGNIPKKEENQYHTWSIGTIKGYLYDGK